MSSPDKLTAAYPNFSFKRFPGLQEFLLSTFVWVFDKKPFYRYRVVGAADPVFVVSGHFPSGAKRRKTFRQILPPVI
jgi:hypothetical protein